MGYFLSTVLAGAINMHENRKYLSVPLDTLIDSVEFCESLVGQVFPACSKLQIGKPN